MENIIVTSDNRLRFKKFDLRCALGRSGVTKNKLEGDGATPVGIFSLIKIFYRADRITLPPVKISTIQISPSMGWCDDTNCHFYNQLVSLPHQGSHEKLFREDQVYDCLIELSYNTSPVTPNKGSAIFLHVARENFTPTEGCIALALDDLLSLISRVTSDTKISVLS